MDFSAFITVMALEILRDIWSIWQCQFSLELSTNPRQLKLTQSIIEPFMYKIELITRVFTKTHIFGLFCVKSNFVTTNQLLTFSNSKFKIVWFSYGMSF